MIKNLNIKIIRTERKKTAIIEVFPGETVHIIAPQELTKTQINTLLRTRSSWILEKLRLIRDIPIPRRREFINGESFPFLGKDYRLKILLNCSGGVSLNDGRLCVCIPKGLDTSEVSSLARQRLIEWYKYQAKIKIKERADVFSKKLVVEPTLITIKEYKARWGSCASNGELAFNWRLIMAPISVLDYIIIHELCHLDVPTHNKTFWKLVSSVKSNYKNDQKWLRFSGLEQII